MEITEFEKKRAANLIWNGAHDYTIETGFRVYDEDGRADMYWNSIIGAVHLHYDWAQLMLFYNSFHETMDQGVYESLFWIAVENAAYEREKEERPVFPYLRRSYAHKKLRSMTGQISEDAAQQRLLAVTYGHFRRALGEDAGLPDLVDVHLLNELELPGELDTGELISRIAAALGRYFGFDPNGRRFLSGDRRVLNPLSLFSLRGHRGKEDVPAGPVRRMSFGYGEHVYEYGSELLDQSRLRSSFARYTAQADNGMKAYLEGVFGRPALDERAAARLEKNYCYGNHAGARLYVTRGEYGQEPSAETAGSYVRRMRREVLQQREKNEKAFAGNRGLYRVQMEKLTARIRNSVMTQLDDQAVRASAGTLCGGRVWRAMYLRDDRIFTKTIRGDSGNLTVDILLDASSSQQRRQETVAAQGYMLAQCLDRVGIPVRVSSFCSLNGYTVMNLYRDYTEHSNEHIFRYFTSGANRDGLAVRLAAGMLRENMAEHRILVVLGDCKPNDVVKVQSGAGGYRDYTGTLGVEDAAAEVHAARMAGITVLGVFTGDEESLPSAQRIFGHGFARIRRMDQFADTVGGMLADCIRLL